MTVVHRPERDTSAELAFTVYNDERTRAYDCTVSRRLAGYAPTAQWWAERGNAGIAEFEAMEWAQARAKEMARRAFAAAGVGRHDRYGGSCRPKE